MLICTEMKSFAKKRGKHKFEKFEQQELGGRFVYYTYDFWFLTDYLGVVCTGWRG